jgi:diguanylate cyclase (GGDEF)-like protein
MNMQMTSTASNITQLRPFLHSQPQSQHQDQSPALLTFGNKLHSLLDASLIIEHFYRETQQLIGYSGLIYQFPEDSSGHSHGILGGHSTSYQLTFNQDDLGRLDFYSAQVLDTPALVQIESHLQALVSPLRNALLYRKALRQAWHDGLTGVKNRAAFDADLQIAIELAQRHGYALSLIVMDLDHFKKANDSQGHSFGDKVLCRASAIAQSCTRSSDSLYRYGGEEFVIIASHSDLEGARQLAERIRQTLYQKNHAGVPGFTLSASFGVAELAQGETAEQLFGRADRALYTAKASGRNQVQTAD